MICGKFFRTLFCIIALVCIGTRLTYASSSLTLITGNPSPFALNVANADGYALQYGGAYSANLNTTNFTTGNSALGILAINLCGCAVLPLNISGGTTLLLGPVVDSSGQENRLTLNITSGQTVQLTGVTSNTGFNAATNDYSALGTVNFGGGNGSFAASLAGNSTLSINFQNANNASLALNGSTMTITNPSVGNFNNIQFGGYIVNQVELWYSKECAYSIV